MRLPYCPSFDILSCEVQVVIDCRLVGVGENPKLVVNNVLDKTGKASLMHNHDSLWRDFGYRIADMAEHDEELLRRALEQDAFDREAA